MKYLLSADCLLKISVIGRGGRWEEFICWDRWAKEEELSVDLRAFESAAAAECDWSELALSESEEVCCCILGFISEKDSDNGRGKFDINLLDWEGWDILNNKGRKGSEGWSSGSWLLAVSGDSNRIRNFVCTSANSWLPLAEKARSQKWKSTKRLHFSSFY